MISMMCTKAPCVDHFLNGYAPMAFPHLSGSTSGHIFRNSMDTIHPLDRQVALLGRAP
jgi:hypothetical protein